MKAFTQKTAIAALAICLSTLSMTSHASTKMGVCEIEEEGKALYKGSCTIDTQENGNVILTGENFSQAVGVTSLSINLDAPNVASIESKKVNGHISTWGEAVRTPLNSPCWKGEGNRFKICAW